MSWLFTRVARAVVVPSRNSEPYNFFPDQLKRIFIAIARADEDELYFGGRGWPCLLASIRQGRKNKPQQGFSVS
jgi:hypothetical protein